MMRVIEFHSVLVKIHSCTAIDVLILGHSTANNGLHVIPVFIHHFLVEPHLGALMIKLAFVVYANFFVFRQWMVREFGIALQEFFRGKILSARSNMYNTVFAIHNTVTSKEDLC